MKKIFLLISVGAVLQANFALAESASYNWSSSWAFTSPPSRNTQLLQADLIEKKQSDYYDFTTIYNIETMNNNYDYDLRQGCMNEGDGSCEYSASTAIGSQNNVDISIYGDDNNLSTYGSSSNRGDTGSSSAVDSQYVEVN